MIGLRGRSAPDFFARESEKPMTDLTARKKMLDTLSDDLVYEGWDLPCKLWVILGDYDDPYLEFVGNYTMDPDHWFMHRADEGTVKDHVLGLVTCYESWCYPAELHQHLNEHQETGQRAQAAYNAIIGPQDHPDHGNFRTLLAVFRDGAVMRIDHKDTGVKSVMVMDDAPPTGPVGDSTIDYMRAVLGIHHVDRNPLHRISKLIEQNPELQAVLVIAEREDWPHDRVSAEIYKHIYKDAPPDIQQEMTQTMPDEVRRYLDANPDSEGGQ